MLARKYRFVAYNTTGQVIAQNDITITARRWKFTSAGAVEYESSEGTPYTMDDAGGLADGSYDAGDVVDNSSDLFIGGDFQLSVTAPASASGDVVIYYQTATNDAGDAWPDNGEGIPVATLNFTSSGTKVTQFQL